MGRTAADAFLWTCALVALLGLAATIRPLRLLLPERRRAWAFVLAGLALWTVAALVGDNAVARAVGYPFVATGIALFGRRPDGRQARGHLLDVCIVVLALGLVLWAPVLDRIVDDRDGPTLSGAVAIAFPIADLVLFGGLARLALAGARGRGPTLALVALGLVLASDVLHGIGGDGTPVAGPVLLLGIAAFAAVPITGSVRQVAPLELPSLRVSSGHWALYGIGLALVPIVFLVEWLSLHRLEDTGLYVVGGLLTTAVVVARLASLFGDLEDARRLALTSERKFRLIFERAPLGISLGRDGRMNETNPALQRLLGYSAEELATMHFLDVTHPDDRGLEEQRELDRGERDSFVAEKRYVAKDGTVIDARAHVEVGFAGGYGMSIIEDVRERRALEEQARAVQRLEAVARLAGGIAHDFNNLMTAVGGYADLLQAEVDGPDQARKVAAIRDAASRASDLTRQLLAFSRQQVLHVREADLCAIVADAQPRLAAILGDGVDFVTDVVTGPVPVRVDPGQIEQVLVNLVANAREAMVGGGTVRLAVAVDGAEAVLTVSDTGPGIPDDVRERIFEPFFTTKGLAEASGLGLATAHGIVHQSGGSIAVESTAGRGARFTIRLPLVPVATPERRGYAVD